MSLCTTLHRRAVTTWSNLLTAHHSGLSLGEESITDFNLLEIASAHHREVRTYKWTKFREGRYSGADWEWWFGSATGWLGVRIQAKCLDLTVSSFPRLSHTSYKKRQVDRLIESSAKDSVVPLYCFYLATAGPEKPFECKCGMIQLTNHARGCCITRAADVRDLIDANLNHVTDVEPNFSPLVLSPLLSAVGIMGRRHRRPSPLISDRQRAGFANERRSSQ
jgi:Family of unknown function (DUF6615)